MLLTNEPRGHGSSSVAGRDSGVSGRRIRLGGASPPAQAASDGQPLTKGAAWNRSDNVAPLHEDQADGRGDDGPGGNCHHGRQHTDFAADAREDGDEGAGHP